MLLQTTLKVIFNTGISTVFIIKNAQFRHNVKLNNVSSKIVKRSRNYLYIESIRIIYKTYITPHLTRSNVNSVHTKLNGWYTNSDQFLNTQ